MPSPFMCHWCDKPTMNEAGICIECEQKYEEGNKDIAATVRELESRVRWLEKGLKEIKSKTLHLDDMIQAVLDGEPTTADEYNAKSVIKLDDEYHAKAKIELEKVNKALDTMKEDEKLVYEEEHNLSPENTVRISDVNKEIAKEWNRDREEKIKGSRDYWEPKKKVPKTGKKTNIIQSIGYRGEDE